MLWSIGGSSDLLHEDGCCKEHSAAFDNFTASAASANADATESPEEKANMQEREAEAMREMR